MAQKTDAELVIDELVAVGDYTRKASEAAGRLVECCERQEEAWRSGAPEHAQAIAAREVAAATDEALRLAVNARQYRSRCDAACERLVTTGQVTAAEREAIGEGWLEVKLHAMMSTARLCAARWAAARPRLAAIEARAGEAGRLATIKALADLIGSGLE